MATKQEQSNVDKDRKERRDYDAGWDRAYDGPYPKDREETILANIAKVSPAFVAGYKAGQARSDYEEMRAQAEQDAIDLDEFFAGLED